MQKNITKKIIWMGFLISIVSVLANLLFFALTQAFGERYIIPLTNLPAGSEPLPVLMIILATIIPAFLATLLYVILYKIVPKAILPSFISITGTALLVSFGGPMEIPGLSSQTRLLLSSMHFIAAVIIIGGLLLFHRQNKKASEPGRG
jgi:hypothetical protein